MPSSEYKPRFSCEISDLQKLRVNRLLSEFGVKKAFFGPILDDVLDLVEKHGNKFIVAITGNMIKPMEIIPAIKNAKDIVEKIEGTNERKNM